MQHTTTSQKIIVYLLMILVLFFFIGPIIWFVLLAFRHPSEAYRLPPQLFFKPVLQSFKVTFVDPGNNAPQLRNSVIVSTGATLLSLPFSLSAAYSLSRFTMRGKEF